MQHGLIFDCDGVLANTEAVICEATIRMFRDMYGVEIQPEDFLPFVGAGQEGHLGAGHRRDAEVIGPEGDPPFGEGPLGPRPCGQDVRGLDLVLPGECTSQLPEAVRIAGAQRRLVHTPGTRELLGARWAKGELGGGSDLLQQPPSRVVHPTRLPRARAESETIEGNVGCRHLRLRCGM